MKRAPTSRETRLTRLICCVMAVVLQCDMALTLTNRSGRVNSFFQVLAKSAYFADPREAWMARRPVAFAAIGCVASQAYPKWTSFPRKRGSILISSVSPFIEPVQNGFPLSRE